MLLHLFAYWLRGEGLTPLGFPVVIVNPGLIDTGRNSPDSPPSNVFTRPHLCLIKGSTIPGSQRQYPTPILPPMPSQSTPAGARRGDQTHQLPSCMASTFPNQPFPFWWCFRRCLSGLVPRFTCDYQGRAPETPPRPTFQRARMTPKTSVVG
jgi:hypothetical protein